MKTWFRKFGTITSTLFFAALLAVQNACVVPKQDFPIDSLLWKKANPELVNLTLATASQKNHQVLVGVLDAGLDYNAPRLIRHLHLLPMPSAGRAYALGWDVLGRDFFPNFQVFNPEDKPGQEEDLSEFIQLRDHGTHVAQLVTLNDPAIGLIPVRVVPIGMEDFDQILKQKNPAAYGAKIRNRVLDSIIEGIEFAVGNGAAVINMSLGLNLDELEPEEQEHFIRRIQEQLVPKIQNEWKDTLLVVAAGNESFLLNSVTQCIPATIEAPDLLSVGALKDKGTIAGYSNQGRFVDIYVQGTDVISTIPIRESNPQENRAKMTGTSMASPIAAHLAAQLKILRPELTPRELRALILNTADIKTLPTEDEGWETTPGPMTIRVMNMPRAKLIARTELNSPENRARWLIPPFAHGQAPQH